MNLKLSKYAAHARKVDASRNIVSVFWTVKFVGKIVNVKIVLMIDKADLIRIISTKQIKKFLSVNVLLNLIAWEIIVCAEKMVKNAGISVNVRSVLIINNIKLIELLIKVLAVELIII